jgi:hypothetical protein
MIKSRIGAALFLVFAFGSLVSAQGVQTGTLRGTVFDAQQLPVPGATVTATSAALQGQRTTVTGMDGTYVLPLLPPGEYEVQYALQGFQPQQRQVTVPLGDAVVVTATLQAGQVKEQVTVTAIPVPLSNATVGANITQRTVEALATSRTPRGIATLAPGVNENTPGNNANLLSISGAFAFDNLFMINGVDINDNISGAPQNLFIEDAIQETQVLSSGISAEYGRFSGGVVNAVTKSGGDRFSGSFRVNLTNPAWTSETPFEVDHNVQRTSDVNVGYEGTFGGPILRQRAWFFGAARQENRSTDRVLDVTGLPYTSKDDNWRMEIKVTAAPAAGHSVQGGFLVDPRTQSNLPAFPDAIDPATLATQKNPNWYVFGNYRGVLTPHLLAETQYSERRWSAEFSGPFTNSIVDSPIFGLDQTSGFYNGPYFDPKDPEERNNRQLTGNLTYQVNKAGTHEIKGGYEWFRSQNTGGNSQSPTGYVFDSDYLTDDDGNPVLDANRRLIPTFVPADNTDDLAPTLLETWIASPGAVLNVDTNTLYARDHWRVNDVLTLDLGLRYEHVRSKATGNIIGVDTDTVVPRLAVAYDPTRRGRMVFHSTYGHYAGRYNENLIGRNANVGNPDEIISVYTGPAGQGRDFAAGFDPANYESAFGDFPTANVIFDKGMSAPVTKEFTVSGGAAGARAFFETTYVWRRTTNIIEDFIQADNGSVEVVRDDVTLGEFTNRVFKNSDIPRRSYQALIFQGHYRPYRDLTIDGSWTVQLENDGNFEGETTTDPAATSVIGDYPEILSAARHYPTGRLQTFERSRVRLWSIYDHALGTYGNVSVSGLLRVDSGRVYSLTSVQRLTAIQQGLLNSADYVDAPATQTVYFGDRGGQTFPGAAQVDISANYALPVHSSLSPWIKFDVFNLFDNDTLIAFDTTVRPDPASQTDALGLRTGHIQGANFGEARSANDYPRSLGLPGGRSFRLSFGFRF